MPDRGRLEHTYAAALQHDLADVPPGATRVGVVRRPTPWFNAVVDENRPALAPPDELLDAFQERREDFELQGLCAAGAHNAAWDDVEFPVRYREFLRNSTAARETIEDLRDRRTGGEDLVLVCYENTEQKRCHRTLLVAELSDGES